MNPRNYRVVHITEYRYSDDVSTSYGRAHLLPRAIPGQLVTDGQLVVDPGADELRSHVDFFGNLSTYYAVRSKHRTLRVTATSNVVVERDVPSLADLDGVTWEEARDATADDVEAREYVLASPLVRVTDAVSEYAAQSFVPARPLGSALADLIRRIHADFEYVSGATSVKTTLGELLHRRQGVCQDFAHLAGRLPAGGWPAGALRQRLSGNDSASRAAEAARSRRVARLGRGSRTQPAMDRSRPDQQPVRRCPLRGRRVGT